MISNALATFPLADPALGPTAILLLDRGVVIERWPWSQAYEAHHGKCRPPGSYAIREGSKGMVVISLLSLMFFATTTPGFEAHYYAQFINQLVEIFNRETAVKLPYVSIGER